ncbi:MAG: 2-hydroxyacid dehydrogenase [Desulfovibrio sp.]
MRKPVLVYYEVLGYLPETLAYIDENFERITLPDPGADADEILARAEVLMAPLGFAVDKTRLERCPGLRVVASSTLSLPHVDLIETARRDIKVVSLADEREFMWKVTPTVEVAWGLIIGITRHMGLALKQARTTRAGRSLGEMTPRMLSRMRLGIVGLGRLGTLTAEKAPAFGMEVLYYSPHSTDSRFTRCRSLIELAGTADVVSLHAHHTPENSGMIGREFFSAMRPGSYFINTARGELVDEGALLEALESGHLAGAGLDVLAGEHSPGFRERLEGNPLLRYAREHDNLLITPHYAGATRDAWIMTQTRTVELAVEAMRRG